MAVRSEDAAANVRVVPTRSSVREVVAIIGVMFTAAGVSIAGIQWAVSNNTAPLALAMRALESRVLSIHKDVGELRGEVVGLRGEVEKIRGEVADLRERVARVETGLEQVQSNQARILELLERSRRPSGMTGPGA